MMFFVEDMGFVMVPDSHTYDEGVIFSVNIGAGYGEASLSFGDGQGTVD